MGHHFQFELKNSLPFDMGKNTSLINNFYIKSKCIEIYEGFRT